MKSIGQRIIITVALAILLIEAVILGFSAFSQRQNWLKRLLVSRQNRPLQSRCMDRMSKTGEKVVINQTGRLHVGIHNNRPDK